MNSPVSTPQTVDLWQAVIAVWLDHAPHDLPYCRQCQYGDSCWDNKMVWPCETARDLMTTLGWTPNLDQSQAFEQWLVDECADHTIYELDSASHIYGKAATP